MIRLSFSAAQKYLTSPFSYYAHYFLRLRSEQLGSALVFGSALDTGLNSLLIDLKDGMAPDLEKAKAAFCREFLKQTVNGEDILLYTPGAVKFSKSDLDEGLLTEEDLSSGLDKSWLSLNRKGQILIEEYHAQVIPRIESVLAVQHEINLPNEAGDVLTGIVDFIAKIDGKVRLCDNKSTSITYTATSASESAQLATYYEALREEFGLEGVAYVTLSKKVLKRKKPRVNIRIIFGEVSEDLIIQTFDQYDSVLTGIRSGQFPCTREICCSTPWGCGYKKFCESNGRNMDGLIVHDKKDRR